VLALTDIFLLIAVTFLVYRKGVRYVRFILLSYGILFISGSLVVSEYFGLFHSELDFQSIGYVGLILCYMIGIADRVNFEREEKRRILEQQKTLLEEKVREQTREISQKNEALEKRNHSLHAINTELEEKNRIIREEKEKLEQRTRELKETQNQLIIKEKLASLGELTAGIAHEIKNPLNFVNNFAELSNELVEEVLYEIIGPKESLSPEEVAEIKAVLRDLVENTDKINEHGKRADRIVKSMMSHASGQQSAKELADINLMLEENLKLAYHGFRQKQEHFKVNFETRLEAKTPRIEMFPHEVAQVLLNIFSNAFYALNEKYFSNGRPVANERPVLTITSKDQNGHVEIQIRDTGPGIPQGHIDKIFNPFFTTKPTNHGNTGLGLSLSHDIIVKAHGGRLKVQSEPGKFTEFTITLPKKLGGA